eukprot:349849-Chlamydomonas_euryale.AAC.7
MQKSSTISAAATLSIRLAAPFTKPAPTWRETVTIHWHVHHTHTLCALWHQPHAPPCADTHPLATATEPACSCSRHFQKTWPFAATDVAGDERVAGSAIAEGVKRSAGDARAEGVKRAAGDAKYAGRVNERDGRVCTTTRPKHEAWDAVVAHRPGCNKRLPGPTTLHCTRPLRSRRTGLTFRGLRTTSKLEDALLCVGPEVVTPSCEFFDVSHVALPVTLTEVTYPWGSLEGVHAPLNVAPKEVTTQWACP